MVNEVGALHVAAAATNPPRVAGQRIQYFSRVSLFGYRESFLGDLETAMFILLLFPDVLLSAFLHMLPSAPGAFGASARPDRFSRISKQHKQ